MAIRCRTSPPEDSLHFCRGKFAEDNCPVLAGSSAEYPLGVRLLPRDQIGGDLQTMLEMIQEEIRPQRAPHYDMPDLERGLQFFRREVNFAALTDRKGRRLPMKGTCGELRQFKCRDCSSAFSKYFSHFEKAEGFRVVECYHCQGRADLLHDGAQQVAPAIAVSASHQ